MYTIFELNELYPTYRLIDDYKSAFLEVVPSRGGIITRWQIGERPILYLDEERFANPNLSVRGGNPILFPICGNLPDNTYEYGGVEYTLKQHGFARDLPWAVRGHSTDGGASLTLVLTSNEVTRRQYPFDFEVVFTYVFKGDSLKIYQEFINLSTEVMPFSVGFHPYFRVNDKKALSFNIPGIQYQNKEDGSLHDFDGTFDFNASEIDVAFLDVKRSNCSFKDSSAGIEIHLDYTDIYSTLVFWTVKGKDFVCVEPWSAPRNSFNTGEHLVYLQPGDRCSAEVEMRITEFQ
ncbi:MAG: hypothetical protein N5P05_002895 [Chroococcopsis gigantea SAG 12.99]|nr:aldose epimerase [Chlorogloea purpurea SAG 13.99]MDV3001289.1 hypothetical protein [Chroococcopsis gigantea SAG 12.99]